MKKTYRIKIRENEKIGVLGIALACNGRDYFDPALRGLVCAHDILEHPVNPHPNGYVDELMAIGGILAGRVDAEWRSDWMSPISSRDLISDISTLVDSGHYEGMLTGLAPRRRYIQDKDFMSEVRTIVEVGVINGLEEYYDYDGDINGRTKARKQYDINTLTSWVIEGYRAHKRRFRNYDNYTISVRLFNQIAEVCDNLLKRAEEYSKATLHVDFTGCRAWVQEEYDY
jgi:hypothetical protein